MSGYAFFKLKRITIIAFYSYLGNYVLVKEKAKYFVCVINEVIIVQDPKSSFSEILFESVVTYW